MPRASRRRLRKGRSKKHVAKRGGEMRTGVTNDHVFSKEEIEGWVETRLDADHYTFKNTGIIKTKNEVIHIITDALIRSNLNEELNHINTSIYNEKDKVSCLLFFINHMITSNYSPVR